AEDGIRDYKVTGVQTCALPICLRVSEGLSLFVEDLDLSLDNEHLTVVGKGGKRRTILLDDPHLVQQLRAYIKRMGYKHGPLFRRSEERRVGKEGRRRSAARQSR